MQKTFSIKRTATAVALIFLFQFESFAAATWTTVGSVGTLDEDSTQLAQFDGPYVGFKETCPPLTAGIVHRVCTFDTGAIHIRYNVTAAGSLPNFKVYALSARFRANTSQRIQIFLKAENLTTGAETIVSTFDSTKFNASTDYQTQSSGCGFPMNFDQNAYFLETAITNSASTSGPSLQTIALQGCSTL